MAILQPDFSSLFPQLSASSVFFRVTPEELNRKAGEVQALVGEMRARFASLGQKNAASRSFWQGDAAEGYREQYSALTADTEQLLAALEQYAEKLNTIAGNYIQAENAVRDAVDTLPADVIL